MKSIPKLRKLHSRMILRGTIQGGMLKFYIIQTASLGASAYGRLFFTLQQFLKDFSVISKMWDRKNVEIETGESFEGVV